MKRIKIICTICFLIIVFSACSKKEETKTIKNGPNEITYNIKNGVVIISGKGNMTKAVSFKNRKDIKEVVIEEGVTSVGNDAFSGCENLKRIVLADSVEKIGDGAFYDTNIDSVVLPNSVKEIGLLAFINKNNNGYLEEVIMPGDVSFKSDYMNEIGWNEGVIEDVIMLKAKKVSFASNLNLICIDYIETDSFAVWKEDDNYNSENGLIYSKDFKILFALPDIEDVEVKDGCEKFDIIALKRGVANIEGDIGSRCNNIRKIKLPNSIKYIEDTSNLNYKEGIPDVSLSMDFSETDIDESEINKIVSCVRRSSYADGVLDLNP